MTSGFHMLREIKLILKINMISYMSGFYLLGFQILILFDDDIKASVKVTDIQKYDFSQS